MTTLILIAIICFAAGIAARHYAPSAWDGAKQWVGRKLFGGPM